MLINDKEKCCGCTACKNICPVDAIEMKEDEKGFKYPIIDKNKCIKCNLCKKVCPIVDDANIKEISPRAYAAYNKNEKIRMQSSSGGIFTLLANEIIKKDGVVFGAMFNDDFFVVHGKAENVEELERFRGSKYIQSDLDYIFKEVKNILESNTYVLFTGTPCQIEGLKKFLMKDYDKLYTQDLICHGVPSKKVWEKYLEHRKKLNNDELEEISFRNKEKEGWNKYNLLFNYKNKQEYINHSEDIFMKIFLSDIALRDSCYNCKFKKKNRLSDITVADFWGINNIEPEMNDEKGISLVMINSPKGDELFDNIKNKIICKEVDFEEAIKYNTSMINSAERHINEKLFFEDLNNMEIDKLILKYNLKG